MIRMIATIMSLIGLLAIAGFSPPVSAQGKDGAAQTPPIAMRHFVNGPERARSAKMRDQYVDFSFDYPESWGVRSDLPSDSANYVEIWSPGKDGLQDYAVAVGWISGSGFAPADRERMESNARGFAEVLGQGLTDYRVTGFGPQRIGRYDSYGWRFALTDTRAGATIHGRADLILPPGAVRGIAVISTISSRTGQVESGDQIGETGSMKAIFDSLRIDPEGQGPTRRFVNTEGHARSPLMRDQYVDFSFDYPANWLVDVEAEDGTAANYVGLAAPASGNGSPLAFAVGTATGSGNAARDEASFEAFVRTQLPTASDRLTDYRLVSFGPQKIGAYNGLGWRYTATRPARDGGRAVKILGRTDLLFPPGSTRGVMIISYVTDEEESLFNSGKLGETGALKLIYDSFRLGK